MGLKLDSAPAYAAANSTWIKIIIASAHDRFLSSVPKAASLGLINLTLHQYHSFLNNQRYPLLDVCGLTCGHSLGLFLPIKTTFFSIATFFSPYTPLRGRNERGGIGNHYHIHAIVFQLSPSISFFNQTAELLLACKYSPYNSRFWPHQIEVFKYRPRHTQLIPIF